MSGTASHFDQKERKFPDLRKNHSGHHRHSRREPEGHDDDSHNDKVDKKHEAYCQKD